MTSRACSNPITLSIDTSTVRGGLAITLGDGRIVARAWQRPEKQQSHSEFITQELAALLKQVELRSQDLELLALTVGPGSFTGLRVGINVAKSLAFALDLPVRTFNSAEVIAQNLMPAEHPLCILLDAYKNSVFFATFRPEQGQWCAVRQPQMLALSELAPNLAQPHWCLGEGYAKYQIFFAEPTRLKLLVQSGVDPLPHPEKLARLALQDSRPTIGWKEVMPLYLRASSAEEQFGILNGFT